jgi:methionyl-tRNA formyltransferase
MVKSAAIVGASWGDDAAMRAGVATAHVGQGDGIPQVGGADRLFFLGFSSKIPDAMCEHYECINFHCTDLRRGFGRGGHPIENLIMRGHTETVITAHRMTSEIDAGPVYCVSEPISLSGNKADICARFVEPVAKMMRWIIETDPVPTPQVGEPVYFKRLSPEDYRQLWWTRG